MDLQLAWEEYIQKAKLFTSDIIGKLNWNLVDLSFLQAYTLF